MAEIETIQGVRVEQIDHIEVFVPARREAARWYQRVLGLQILRDYEHWADNPGGPLMISSDGGSTKVALFRGPPQSSSDPVGFIRLAFRVAGEDFLTFLDALPELELTDGMGRSVSPDLVKPRPFVFSLLQ